jgi:hypothetical protein
MNLKRIAAYSLLILCSALAAGFLAWQLVGTAWAITGLIFISSSTWYFLFSRPITQKRLAHVAAAFFMVELMDRSIPLLLGAPITEFFSNWRSSAYHLGAAALGFTIARLSSNKSFKPNPLRGSA